MSLSPEALAQLEGLDLQEAKDGFNFVVPTESGRPTLTDLSADEMNGFRGWDLSGVLAGLNSLTFEKMHPELVESPAETSASAPAAEGDLPDWLKADDSWSRKNFPLDEPEPELPALPPEEPAAALDGPTAEEAAARLAEAARAGSTTQEIGENGRGQILPADAMEEEEVEERTQNRLMDWLKDVDWKNAAKEGALMLGPAIFSGVLWETMPQLHQALEYFVGGGMIGGFLTEGLLGVLSQAERIHPRFAGLARVAAARRGTGFLIAQMAASAGIGIVGAEGLDRLFQVHAAAQPVVIGNGGGSGEGHVDPTINAPVHGNVDIRDYYHGGSDVNLPQPSAAGGGLAGGQSSVLSSGTSELVNRAGEVAAQESREIAEAAQGAVAQAAAQAAEVARIAALQQGPTVAELAAQMPKHTISEAIYQMIGNVPHRGEVTNVLFRAIGDKVNSLNEGAIKAAAQALRPVFDNIDKVVTGSGATYTEGGRAAVEAMRGFNSPEAQAIRAANMADLEAAGNLLNNVIGPVIK